MQKIKIGVIGGAGYTAGELLRIFESSECGDCICAQQQQCRQPYL